MTCWLLEVKIYCNCILSHSSPGVVPGAWYLVSMSTYSTLLSLHTSYTNTPQLFQHMEENHMKLLNLFSPLQIVKALLLTCSCLPFLSSLQKRQNQCFFPLLCCKAMDIQLIIFILKVEWTFEQLFLFLFNHILPEFVRWLTGCRHMAWAATCKL